MKFTETHTLYASYLGYITQATINNLPPLLFVSFHDQFGIPLEQISLLITMNFMIQIIIDLFSIKYADRIGYRRCVVAAHIFSALGLILLGILPFLIHPFAGIAIAMAMNAVGGGMTEVLISPIVESLPGEQKAAAMSILHSFYCWGHMAVVILSAVYFSVIGTEQWRYLPFLWAIIPIFNTWFFTSVPLYVLVEESEKVPLKKLFSSKIFWILMFIMLFAGASEQAMGQWSSYFAEKGLGVSKTLGDLLGPCAFALTMGLSRSFYAKKSSRIKIQHYILFSAALSVFAYLLTVFAPYPILSLAGCAICGYSVGMLWPGVYSLSSQTYPTGGTALFAMLALSGDIGCGAGAGMVGIIANAAQNGFSRLRALIPSGTEAEMKIGLLFAALFPTGVLLGIFILKHASEKNTKVH